MLLKLLIRWNARLEKLISDLSVETSSHHRIPPIINANRLHDLDVGARNLRAKEDLYLDAFFKHRWYSVNPKQDKSSLLQTWNAFFRNVEDIGREARLQNLTQLVLGLKSVLQPVQRSSCISCLARREFRAARKAIHVCVRTTRNVPKKMCTPFLRLGKGTHRKLDV